MVLTQLGVLGWSERDEDLVLANRLDKAVILTDGYGSMKEENQEQLESRTFRALTVLFSGRGQVRALARGSRVLYNGFAEGKAAVGIDRGAAACGRFGLTRWGEFVRAFRV